jgi:hypothetical protein
MRTIHRVVVAATLVMSALAMAPSAQARAGDVVKRGSCSASSDWKVKLKPDNGRIELEFEVDSNTPGQTWHVRIVQNGQRIFRGTRVTKAPSGSFTVRVRPDNTVGRDAFLAVATNRASGESCMGHASIG